MFRSSELLNRSRSRLLIVDVQEKLIPAIPGADEVVRRIEFLLNAAQLFSIPVFVSEQYPQGLGQTVCRLADHPAASRRFDKVRFSAADGFCGLIGSPPETAPDAFDDCDQIVIAGMESHVCVLQTAIDLLGRGFRVFVVEDAVAAGSRHDHCMAMQRLTAGGATICTAESAAFEWCAEAGTDTFRSLRCLVRSLRSPTNTS